jgi:hypothetical protein
MAETPFNNTQYTCHLITHPSTIVDAPTHLAQARSAEAAWQGSQAEEEDSYFLVGMA